MVSPFDWFWVTVPSVLLTGTFVLLAWRAVVWMGDTGGFTFAWLRFPTRLIRTAFRNPVEWVWDRFDRRQASIEDSSKFIISEEQDSPVLSEFSAIHRPIYWRERLGVPMLRNRVLFCVLCMTGFLLVMMTADLSAYRQVDRVGKLILGCMVLTLLVMVSLSTRVFAKERDLQTLESLLVLPMSNGELLQEKSAILNRAVWWLASPIALVAVLSCVCRVFDFRHGDFSCRNDLVLLFVSVCCPNAWWISRFAYHLWPK